MTINIKDTAFRAYEDYVLKDKDISEGLKNLVEGSDSYDYLKCINLLTKKGLKLTEEEKNFIESYTNSKINEETSKIFLRYLILQYDAAETKEKKADILEKLNKRSIKAKFDHSKPNDLQIKAIDQEKSTTETEGSKGLFDSLSLSEELEDLYKRQRSVSNYRKGAIVKMDLSRLVKSDFMDVLMIMGTDLQMLDDNPKFYDTCAKWLNEDYAVNKHYSIRKEVLENMTIEQMNKLKKKVPEIDVNSDFAAVYFTKKFDRELSDEENLYLTNQEKRDNLIKMYEYAKKLPYNLAGLKSYLLLEILEYGLKLNVFSDDYFIEYLKLPVRDNFVSNLIPSNQRFWSDYIKNVQTEHNKEGNSSILRDKDKELLTSYLEYFFSNGSKIEKFQEYFKQDFLIEVLENTMLMSGKKVEFNSNNTTRLEELATHVNIIIETKNKEVFEIGEDISLWVSLKNISTLFIKVFEINTENYYRKNMEPFKTDINLDGLIASIERTKKFEKPPHIKFQEQLLLPELKGKVGLFVIELIGNGRSSRAVIKIGTLSVITKQTTGGQICYILDGKRKICCHESTGIWMANQYFKADLEKGGKIVIPYVPSGGSKKEKAILLHQGLAQLVDITQNEETYSLKCGFYLLSESALMGKNATILIRPQLFINERMASIELLKNISCVLYSENYTDNIPSTKTYPNLSLSENKELAIEFQVGTNMEKVRIEFVAEVQNITKSKKDTLKASHCFQFVTHKNQFSIAEFHLKLESDSGYKLFVIGKNGEPITNSRVKVTVKTCMLTYAIENWGVTDKDGGIKLGLLKDVTEVSASMNQAGQGNSIKREWKLPSKTVMQYPKFIDIIEDEDVELPISNDFANERLYLRNVNRANVLADFSSAIKVTSNKGQLYSLVKISKLKTGIYLLAGIGEDQIKIRVHKGKYWDEDQNYILKKYSLLENCEKQGFIKIKSVGFENDNKHMKLQIEGATKNQWRVHVMLFRYLPEDLNALTLRLIAKDNFVGNEYYFQKWKNFYLSNRELSSEFRYCFDRLYQPRHTGNMLDRPKLLLKRTFVRNTVSQQEEVSAGTSYEPDYEVKAQLMPEQQQMIPETSYQRYSQAPIRDQSNYMSMGQEQFRCATAYRGSSQQAIRQPEHSWVANDSGSANVVDSIYSYQNFLGLGPMTLFNVPASADGNVHVELSKEFKDLYSCVLILAVDKGSVAHYLHPLPGGELQKRDLSLPKPLDPAKLYSEMRTTQCLQKHETHSIDDVVNTKLQIIDSLEKVSLVMEEVIRLENRSIKGSEGLKQLLRWNAISEDEKNKVMSKFTSHELHLFIYKKDPAYFNKVVRDYLQNKMEMTFMDYYLLEKVEEVTKFADDPALFMELNPLEKALLVEVLAKTGKKSLALTIAQRLRNPINSQSPNITWENKIFDTVLSLGSLKTKKDEIEKLIEEEKGEEIAYEQMSAQRAMYSNVRYDEGQRYSSKSSSTSGPNSLAIRELGQTKEYIETNYYKKTSFNDSVYAVSNARFWVEYAEHMAEAKDGKPEKPFLSHHFIYLFDKLTELAGVLSLLDLPFTAPEHGFKITDNRSAELKAESNLIIFKKEIKESKGDIKSNLLVAQQYIDYEVNNNKDYKIEEFLSGHVYIGKVVIINISSDKLDFDVLVQIPQGALPLGPNSYQNSYSISLNSYLSYQLEYKFYFPQPGKFTHFSPNASINSVVISKANNSIITVLKEKSKISETNFRDVVSTGNHALILKFVQENPVDTIKNFMWDDLYWLLKDYKFFDSLITILGQQKIFNNTVWSYSIYHNREDLMMEYFSMSKYLKGTFGYYFDSKYVKVRPKDSDMHHLDYYPLVNSRTHKHLLGDAALATNFKQPLILNQNLYKTYKMFILYLIEKPVWDLEDKMNLVYYLLLQDRVTEALKVFKKIDPNSEIQKEGRFRLQYDYMTAYLDFYTGEPKFELARKIVAKYLNYPLITWQLLFIDMDQQLRDFDGLASTEDEEVETKEMLKKKMMSAEPILNVELDGKSVVVSYNNIEEIAVKYYIINLEILFSHTPFLTQNAEGFSYVKPNSLETIKLDPKQKDYVIKIPEQYSSQNVLIEINSGAKQCLVTYFSTSLKLQIFENYGELKVLDANEKQLSQVYVKVFIMKQDGKAYFYKDGYTDIRGRFDYASLSDAKLKEIKKFAVFVMNDKYGSLIRECKPPANVIQHEYLGTTKPRLFDYYNAKMWLK